MKKWFESQGTLVQLILLLIPVVNWVIEVCIRWEVFLKKGGLIHLILAIFSIPGLGVVFGWIDFVCVLLTKKLFLAD